MNNNNTLVCKHNQFGYCKHGTLCNKRHEDKICPKNNSCDDKVCEMRHPKRCKFFDMNKKCKFENCAYDHSKDENKVKIEHLEAKCNALETEVTYLKEEQEKVNPRIDLMGRGVMKLKREVERLTLICNGMIYTKEITNNENKSPVLDKEKKNTKPKHKVHQKQQSKEENESVQESRKGMNRDVYNCNKCDEAFEKETYLNSHMQKKHDAENDFKCDECGFRCEGLVTLRKHVNTKHPQNGKQRETGPTQNEAMNESLKKNDKENEDIYKPDDGESPECETPVVCDLIGCCWCKYEIVR